MKLCGDSNIHDVSRDSRGPNRAGSQNGATGIPADGESHNQHQDHRALLGLKFEAL